MDHSVKEFVNSTSKQLVSELSEFLNEDEKLKRWNIVKKLWNYSDDCLERTEGHLVRTAEFARFTEILYGCQQMDDYGAMWAPDEEKVKKWISFLEGFSV